MELKFSNNSKTHGTVQENKGWEKLIKKINQFSNIAGLSIQWVLSNLNN
jgi:hypothetical protein